MSYSVKLLILLTLVHQSLQITCYTCGAWNVTATETEKDPCTRVSESETNNEMCDEFHPNCGIIDFEWLSDGESYTTVWRNCFARGACQQLTEDNLPSLGISLPPGYTIADVNCGECEEDLCNNKNLG